MLLKKKPVYYGEGYRPARSIEWQTYHELREDIAVRGYVAELTQLLHDKGILSDDDILSLSIFRGYEKAE